MAHDAGKLPPAQAKVVRSGDLVHQLRRFRVEDGEEGVGRGHNVVDLRRDDPVPHVFRQAFFERRLVCAKSAIAIHIRLNEVDLPEPSRFQSSSRARARRGWRLARRRCRGFLSGRLLSVLLSPQSATVYANLPQTLGYEPST